MLLMNTSLGTFLKFYGRSWVLDNFNIAWFFIRSLYQGSFIVQMSMTFRVILNIANDNLLLVKTKTATGALIVMVCHM